MIMTKKAWSLLLIIVLSIIAGIYLYSKDQHIGPVKAKLHYMAYACGDCYPQYNVKSIESSITDLPKLKNQQIHLEFTEEMEKEINSIVEKCTICFDYDVSGVLFKRRNGEYMIKVEEYELNKTFEGCCDG